MISSRDKQAATAHLLGPALLVGVLMLLPINHVHATRVYKSIDAEGNVTYSSTPPTDAVETEKIDVPTDYDAGTSTAHKTMIDEIRAAATQLEADRKQRERARETARIQVQEAEETKQGATPAQPVINYYPVNPLGFVHPHRPRPPRHHPPHPGPPLRQPDSDQQ